MNAADVIAAFRARGWMLATAESCTGGMIAAALTDIPGSSAVFDRGFVTYSNAAKHAMLGVDPAVIDRGGAVSEAVARAMAEGALARSDATASVAVTGVAGPGGTAAKPEGMVWLACAHREKPTTAWLENFGAIGRAAIRARTVAVALHALAATAR